MPNVRRTLVRAGADLPIDADEGATLLEVIRKELGVRSASLGCRDGSCGACRVLVDGELVPSCRVRWNDVKDRATLETYEDLERDAAATRATEAFASERPTRCKLCVGALGVTAVALARAGESGDAEAIEGVLTNATCMCTGRGSWRRALKG